MKEFLVWWVGIEAVGLAAFPLTYAFFHRLPDRGFAFSKVVGFLFLGYGLWAGALVGLFPNSRGSVFLLLLVIAGLSMLAAGRRRHELATYLRSGWRYVVFVEAMFLAVLAAAVFLRSFAPQINSGEKPFELAFLNSISRSQSFPPPDPWLAGHSISYYYFGYVMISALTKLVALGTSVTFFLGLSLMATLASVTAFGLVYNLIMASRGGAASVQAKGPALVPRAVIFGLAGVALMLVVSNLEGVFELMARHGVGSRGFYGLLGINGLDGPYDCAATPGDCAQWYPTRFYWWWWATRMGSAFDVQEFPFFSLHFGDLHAHVMAMPFLITLFAVTFQTVLAAPEERLNARWGLRQPGRFLLLALLLGGIAFIDAWAIPLAVLMVLASAAVVNWLGAGQRRMRVVADTVGFGLPVLAAMFVFYLPFYLHLEADTKGIDITQVAAASSVPRNSLATRPLHLLLFWAPLLWLALSFIAGYLRGRWRETLKPGLLGPAILAWAAPLGLWAFIIAVVDGPGALTEELSKRGANLITIFILAASVTAVALSFLHQLGRAGGRDGSQLFALYLMGFAFLMLLGAELYYVKDLLGWRANTVFRFWHQSWIILSIVGAYGLYRLTLGWRLPRLRLSEARWPWLAAWGAALGVGYTVIVAVEPWHVLYERWWTATLGLFAAGASILAYAVAGALRGASLPQAGRRLGWLGVSVIILGAGLVYPVTVTFDRTGGFTNSRSLNGLAFLQHNDPAEYDAILWLNANVAATPVILEAADAHGDFGEYGRVSSRTGLPTVIGWPGHEVQWRGYPGTEPLGSGRETPFTARPDEVAIIYTTSDVGVARALLDKYRVQYVYVGRLERRKYGEGGLAKFRDFMVPVFENEAVTIYRMPEVKAASIGASR